MYASFLFPGFFSQPPHEIIFFQGSGTLGRALIISNTCNNTRPGCEDDFENINRMLDRFGYITVGEHKAYTAQVSA